MTDATDLALAQLIRLHRDRLATVAVERQYSLAPERWTPLGSPGLDKSIRDMGYHVDYLAESVTAADTSLLEEYVAWVKVLFAGLGFSDSTLLNSLKCLSEALIEVLPPDAARRAVIYVTAAEKRVETSPTTLPTFVDGPGPLGNLARRYLSSLLVGDRQQASRLVLDAVDGGMSVRDVYIHVFQATQREVGRLWQTNEISVAQEHYCTAATQLIMSQLYPHIFSAQRRGRRFVGTCVGGELHELGVRMVADFLEMDGWDTYYLGANTPPEAILSTVSERKVDVLGISATMTFHIGRVTDLISRVRSDEAGANLKILVGGYPFNISGTLWQTVGADAFAGSAQQAVSIANQLVS